MENILSGLLYVVLGYLCGSLPFALWITRWFKGIDVRDGGSGHVTTTNTIRQAGWGPGFMVFVLDISKGFLPTYIATSNSQAAWVIALTATAAVAGHCWPVFAQFRGGMGLATAGGSILAVYPLGFLTALGLLIVLTLTLRHSARAAFVFGLLLPLLFWFSGQRQAAFALAVGVGLVIAIRFLSDWNRQYRELWLDREKPNADHTNKKEA